MILERQVAASSDDCFAFPTTIYLTRAYLFIDDCTKYVHAYMRFLNIAICEGTIIRHAYIDLCSDVYYGGMTDLKIYGIKEPNTNTFLTQAGADGRPVTEAYTDWIMRDWLHNEFWNPGEWWGYTNDPRDIKDVIQEIVNQDGWEAGNALAIKTTNTPLGGAGRGCYSWDYGDHSLAPKLYIEYELLPEVPSKVTGLNATNVTAASFKASWNPNPIEEGTAIYRIYLRKAE